MGIDRMGAPTELILMLSSEFKIKQFVETGTFQGNTASWASKYFNSVITIEKSDFYFRYATNKWRDLANIRFINGDSRDEIQKVLVHVIDSSIIWLDSHWCGQQSYGEKDQCPLLDELIAIMQNDKGHFIFIDDARLFLSPPPLPNNMEKWPTIVEIIQTINNGPIDRFIVVFEDVIIAVPIEAKEVLSNWCQEKNTLKWNALKQSKNENNSSALRLLHAFKTKSVNSLNKSICKLFSIRW